MKNYMLFITLLLALLSHFLSFGQEKQQPVKTDTIPGKVVKYMNLSKDAYENMQARKSRIIGSLEEEHRLYVSDIKTELKEYVMRLNKSIADGDLGQEKADQLKTEYAKHIAMQIAAHRKKINGEIEFTKVRTSISSDDIGGSSIEISTEKGIEINIRDFRKNKKELLTTSGFTLGAGFNFMSGEGLGINDFSYENNNYFSLGYQWQTAISKNHKWRMNYGIAYQSQKTELNGNRIFSPNTDNTQVVGIGFDVKDAKFRQDQLIFPLQLEYGGNSKKEYEDGRIRYNQWNTWKVGIGGFVGFNMSSRLKLRYEENGRDIKQATVNAFDTNPFVYGIDAYVGRDNFTFFGRMNLNKVFKSDSVDAQYVSFGIRLQ
jgi:hypothetical protein